MATLQGVQAPDSVPPPSAQPESVSPESAELTPESGELLPASVPPQSTPELESVPPESVEPESVPPESAPEITPESVPPESAPEITPESVREAPAPIAAKAPTKEPTKTADAALVDPPMPKRRNAPISETFATDGPIDIPISTTPDTPTFTAKGTQLVKPPTLPIDVKIVIAGVPVRGGEDEPAKSAAAASASRKTVPDADAPPVGVPAAPKFGPPPMSVPRPVPVDLAALEAARDLPPLGNQRRVGMIVGVVVTLFFVGVLLAIIGLSNE